MAAGKYHIQLKLAEGLGWRTDLRMQSMGKDFAKGAFFVLRGLQGGNCAYRLVKCNVPPNANTPIKDIEVLDAHTTGEIKLN